MALPFCFQPTLRAQIAAALDAADASAKVKVYCQVGQYGCGAYFLGEDPNNTEGGIRIAFWRDLSGNGNHIKQVQTLTKQPELVTVGADSGLRFTADTMVIPPAWLSGTASWQIIWGSRKTTVGGANQVLLAGDDTDLKIRWVSGTTLQCMVGGAGNYALIADSVLDPRLYSVRFNGAGTTNAERLQIWIDGAWRQVTYTGTIPAVLPAITSLRLCEWAGLESFKGETFAFIGANPALTDAEFDAIVGIA